MRKVITLLNKKNGSGKTTLALNLASVLAKEFGMKTGVLEIGDGMFDTGTMMDIAADHTLNGPGDISRYYVEKTGFHLFWDLNWEKAVRYFNDALDVLLVDTEGFPSHRLFDLSDTIVIPAAMNPYDMQYAAHTAKKLLEMNYPASCLNVIVNKAANNILSTGDIQQVFRNSRVIALLPHLEAVAASAGKGFIYCSKDRKDPFYKEVRKAAEILLEGGSKQHLAILDKEPAGEGHLPRDVFPGPAAEAHDEAVSAVKKHAVKLLFEAIDIKNLEKDALTHPDKKSRIFADIKNKVRDILDGIDPSMKNREEREGLVTEIFDEVTGLGAIE